jgi:FKBP-type peptidyl-prolyl cis-trans isomerase SlyD
MAIKKNQIIKLNYELKINGEVIDNNIGSDPIEFTYGSGDLIPGLESRIVDMKEGETKQIKVPAEEGYGKYDENLSEVVPKEAFEGIALQIGLVLEADTETGEVVKATVTEVTNDEVTVDYNHPLAGCDLEFTVTVKAIV